jgi:uncharacterized membrane protein YkvA (DUF1232 family)
MSKSEREPEAKKARDSKSYQKAKSKAEEYARSPDKLTQLLNQAKEKARRKSGPLAEVWDSLTTCFRMVKAYANGSYREIPWQSLVMIVTALIYFVMPFDLVPDFIVALGMIDDVALLGWTIKTIAADIDAFARWEATTV